MIKAIQQNLKRGIILLEQISDDVYANSSVAPYYSSIGANMRHVLDFFSCIFDGLNSCEIDLTLRKRNQEVEQKTAIGINYFNTVISQLKKITPSDLNRPVKVTDDLGLGKITTNYTLANALIQAHNHAIHHFASVGYIVNQLGLELSDEDFGYNPTTPKKEEANNSIYDSCAFHFSK
ncbi:MAG: DinB family protein [Polaribacter sp.]